MSASDISKWLSKKLKVEHFNVTNIVANADIGTFPLTQAGEWI